MGRFSPPQPVARLIVAFSASESVLQWGREVSEQTWGPIALQSELFQFVETDYYAAAMGAPLLKQFWIFDTLQDPGKLADWKIACNRWEDECAEAGLLNASRPINLDAGYVDLGKFVLASSKDHAHRIYLRDGVFAETTLYFRDGAWRPREWTFPDYQRADYQEFLLSARGWYRRRMRS